MMLFKLGLRQTWLYKRQNGFNIAAIAINLALLIFYVGMFRGYISEMKDNIIDFQTGDFQVHTTLYEKNDTMFPLTDLIHNPDQLKAQLLMSKEVHSVGKRVEFKGLLSNGIDQAFIIGVGLNPGDDPQSDLIKRAINQGRSLNPQDTGIIIGSRLASMLDVSVGDTLKLYAQTQYKSHNLLRVPVRGIFEFGFSKMDKHVIFTPLSLADSLLTLEGAVSELMIRKTDSFSYDVVQKNLENTVIPPKLKLRPWTHYAQGFVQEMKLDFVIISLLLILLMSLVVFSILNTITMSLMDRIRVLGTLRALGFSRNQLHKMLLIEIMLIGLIGGILGCLLGGIIDWFMITKGISLGKDMVEMANIPISDTIYSKVSYIEFVGAIMLGLFATFLGSISPIKKFKKQSVCDMLTHH